MILVAIFIRILSPSHASQIFGFFLLIVDSLQSLRYGGVLVINNCIEPVRLSSAMLVCLVHFYEGRGEVFVFLELNFGILIRLVFKASDQPVNRHSNQKIHRLVELQEYHQRHEIGLIGKSEGTKNHRGISQL